MNDPIPDNLPDDIKALCSVIIDAASRFTPKSRKCVRPNSGGCRTFWLPEEMKEHEPSMDATGVALVVMCDGGDFAPFFNMDYCDYTAFDRMSEALKKEGFYAEAQYGWLHYIYRL